MPESNQCSYLEQDLVLYLYDELPSSRRAAVDDHLSGCDRCRSEVGVYRQTLGAVDRARIPQVAASAAPPDWEAEWRALERSLGSARSGPSWSGFLSSPLLKAAVVLLVAGVSFTAGRQWDSGLSPLLLSRLSNGIGVPGPAADSLIVPQDSVTRMRLFSEQTHGYLDRSRMVLLEFANGREAATSSALREASSNLLRETKAARRVAGQMADPRIEGLLAQVEGILGQISQL